MIRIRIGNDIPIVWKFFTMGVNNQRVPYILKGKNIKIVMTDQFGRKKDVSGKINNNSISWIFRGKEQSVTGSYTFTFYENFDKNGMKAIDKIKPFSLVKSQEIIERGTICGCCSSMDINPIIFESEIAGDISGISTYRELPDKPKINHIVLVGDKSLAELGIEPKHPYISLERLRPYLYRVTFDSLPEDDGGYSPINGGCSSYVKDGKLYTNLDWDYDNTASFIVRTRDFEGQSFVGGLVDGSITDALVAQLPYRIHRGINNHGIKLASHILYNDWSWSGCGEKNINLTRLPFLVLSKVKSMATIEADLDGVLDNLYAPEGLATLGYLLQIIVTDGVTTYAIMPPTEEGQPYQLQDITANPKLANFRWVADAQVERTALQLRPTGVERWNMMPCPLEDLRFTKAYEEPSRLSEFIGLRETTKDSSDAELESIFVAARELYLRRARNGETWQTMESSVYGDRLESLWIQENWKDNAIAGSGDVEEAPADGYAYGRKNKQWTRIQGDVVRHGTTEYWNSQIGFIPEDGMIIVYDDYSTVEKEGETVNVPNIKIGTGNSYVQDLAFVGDSEKEELLAHIADSERHITELEREAWNAKLSVDDEHETEGETLIFIR